VAVCRKTLEGKLTKLTVWQALKVTRGRGAEWNMAEGQIFTNVRTDDASKCAGERMRRACPERCRGALRSWVLLIRQGKAQNGDCRTARSAERRGANAEHSGASA
jgi:hypothetical protein